MSIRRASRGLRPHHALPRRADLLVQPRAPLSTHHRLKTHGGWRCTPVERGTYLWTSPLGLSFLRDHEGTLDVTRDQPTGPTRTCAHPPDS